MFKPDDGEHQIPARQEFSALVQLDCSALSTEPKDHIWMKLGEMPFQS